jgi:hypothetical protein
MTYRQVGLLALLSLSLVTAPAMAQEAPGQGRPPMTASSPRTAPADTVVLDPRFDQQVLQARSLRPPRSAWRASGEMLAGFVGGGVTAAGGFLIGGLSGLAWYDRTDEPCSEDGDCDDAFEALGYAFMGGSIGLVALYPLGTGLGVALAGRADDQTGSIGAAVTGSYAGALLGAVAGVALGALGAELERGGRYEELDSGLITRGGVIGMLVGAPIGAWIGFDRTRAYDGAPPPPPLAGLVSMDENQARLTVPVISIAPDPLHAGHVVTSVRVIDARF